MKGRLIPPLNRSYETFQQRRDSHSPKILIPMNRSSSSSLLPPNTNKKSILKSQSSNETIASTPSVAAAASIRSLHQEIPASRAHCIFLATLACLQNSLVGGLIYGWASFNICLTGEPDHGGAGLTLPQSTWIFSIASCVGMGSTLVLGCVLDHCGPRICSVVSHATIAIGCQVFASATQFHQFVIASCFLAFGGPGIQVSIVHLANLFPENQFTALSLLNGTISISFLVLEVFSWLWQHYEWLGYQQLFGWFSVVVGLSLLASVCFWPDHSYKAPRKTPVSSTNASSTTTSSFSKEPTLEDDYIEAITAHPHLVEQPLNSFLRKQDSSHQIERHHSFILSRKSIEAGIWDMVSLKDAPFRRQFWSGSYTRGNLFFGVSCFLANFYVASITTELADANEYSVQQQNNLTQLFTLIMSTGILASFVIGLIMDHSGVEVATSVTIALAMIHKLILIFFSSNRPLMLLGFCFYVLFRQFLFPVSIALITSRLGFKFFGLLNGISFLISGISQLFMIPLVRFVHGTCHRYNSTDVPLITNTCDHGKWQQLHIVELLCLLLLLLVPFYDHRANLAQKERVKQLVVSSWRSLHAGTSPILGNSYGSFPSPSVGSHASNRGARDELDVLEEEGITF